MARLRMGQLSRRERQIMDILYRLGEASAEDVRGRMPDAPGNATVRRQLGLLEEKGLLQHRVDGQVFIYRPTVPREEASESAIRHVIDTFFGGSVPRAVTAMLSMSGDELSEEELRDLNDLIAAFEQREDRHD